VKGEEKDVFRDDGELDSLVLGLESGYGFIYFLASL
jgi:hypothetical protein